MELAALAYAILIAPATFWSPLSEREKANVVAFLGRINSGKIRDKNWLLFRILTNLALQCVGAPYNRDHLKQDWERIDSFYLGEGWYGDGVGEQCDYYGAFAIHFYSLIYARFAAATDSRRAALVWNRASEFASQFINWFSSDGSAGPTVGASLTRWT